MTRAAGKTRQGNMTETVVEMVKEASSCSVGTELRPLWQERGSYENPRKRIPYGGGGRVRVTPILKAVGPVSLEFTVNEGGEWREWWGMRWEAGRGHDSQSLGGLGFIWVLQEASAEFNQWKVTMRCNFLFPSWCFCKLRGNSYTMNVTILKYTSHWFLAHTECNHGH